MSNFESHQSPKGNISGPFLRAFYPFGDEAASDPTVPAFALLVKPRLDWNAKPPAQKTAVYFSLRHQSFQYNKLCLAFLGVFFILSHSSSIYPAFVCFSSAAFPSNSLFSFRRRRRRALQPLFASFARIKADIRLLLRAPLFLEFYLSVAIFSYYGQKRLNIGWTRFSQSRLFVRLTVACSNDTDSSERWWRRLTSAASKPDMNKWKLQVWFKAISLVQRVCFCRPGESRWGLEAFDFLVDGGTLKTRQRLAGCKLHVAVTELPRLDRQTDRWMD